MGAPQLRCPATAMVPATMSNSDVLTQHLKNSSISSLYWCAAASRSWVIATAPCCSFSMGASVLVYMKWTSIFLSTLGSMAVWHRSPHGARRSAEQGAGKDEPRTGRRPRLHGGTASPNPSPPDLGSATTDPCRDQDCEEMCRWRNDGELRPRQRSARRREGAELCRASFLGSGSLRVNGLSLRI
jgi:hypothetical protein